MSQIVAVPQGVALTVAAPRPVVSGGDFLNGNDVSAGAIVEYVNGTGAAITVLMVDPGHTPAGTSPATITPTSIPASGRYRVKPSAAYVDSNNTVTFTYGGTITSAVTVEAYT